MIWSTRAGRLLWLVGAFCLLASISYEYGYGNGVVAGVHARWHKQRSELEPAEDE